MFVSPFVKTPLTDLTSPLFTQQYGHPCGNMEMKVVNCFEAYGADRAMTKCADLIDDFHECSTKLKQRLRVAELRNERFKQISSGERSSDNAYIAGPSPDSFPY